MPKFSSALRPSKPKKPHKDFPLFPHNTRRWAKKIRGKLHYFGPWTDPDAALAKWLEQKDDLLAGRMVRRAAPDELTVRELVNRFLNSKRLLVDSGELALVTWANYRTIGETLAAVLGAARAVSDLRPDDFERLRAHVAKGKRGKPVGPVLVGNFITRAKVIFKYAIDNELIEGRVRFGQGFTRPKKNILRKLRNERELRMFTADELRKIVKAASQPLKAMILLGANCGLGNSDCGQLPLAAVDLKEGWLTFPRPKTHVLRKAALWPETITAINEWLVVRPKAKDEIDAGLVFLTRCGAAWHKGDVESPANPISAEMRKLLDELGIKRARLSFYGLRHGFETIAGQTRDQPAVDCVMGHAEAAGDMAAVYREAGGDDTMDDRLRAVAAHVRAWLFRPAVKAMQKSDGTTAR